MVHSCSPANTGLSLKELQAHQDEPQNTAKALPKDVHEYPAITERDDAQGGVVTCPGQPDEWVTDVPFSIPHHLLTISAVAEHSEGQ